MDMVAVTQLSQEQNYAMEEWNFFRTWQQRYNISRGV